MSALDLFTWITLLIVVARALATVFLGSALSRDISRVPHPQEQAIRMAGSIAMGGDGATRLNPRFLLATVFAYGVQCVGLGAHDLAQIEENRPFPLGGSIDAHNAAERTAQFYCIGVVTKAFENYSGPPEARQYAQGAFFMSCVLKKLPPDWIDRDVIRGHAAELAGAALRADPSIEPCLLSACMIH